MQEALVDVHAVPPGLDELQRILEAQSVLLHDVPARVGTEGREGVSKPWDELVVKFYCRR